MSKKTVASLLKVAELCKVPVEEPLVLPTGKQRRYANAADLYFMEQNLFRPEREATDTKHRNNLCSISASRP